MRALSVLSALVLLGTPETSLEPPTAPPALRVTFDARLAEESLEFLTSGRATLIPEMASLPAAVHLLAHARAWEYDVPKNSAVALVTALVTPRESKQERAPAARKALAYFNGPLQDDTSWLDDVSRGLPPDGAVPMTLFLTFGYDIGVAGPGTASLNAAHPHFEPHPRELLYYAIHELHHSGFMTIQPPTPMARWITASDLLAQSEYALQLEGMAVWAAWDRRAREGALAWDEDYAALADERGLRELEAKFLKTHRALETLAHAGAPADKTSRALLLDLYGKDRVFYRFGAHAARQIELREGRGALVELVKSGPRTFLETYLQLRNPRQTPRQQP